jgi:hypothetical protein
MRVTRRSVLKDAFKSPISRILDLRLVVSDWGQHRAPSGCFAGLLQRTREKSLVAMCSEFRRNPPDISKGIFQGSISRFESWRPSQPVPRFLAISSLWEKARLFRALARRQPVSAVEHLTFLGSNHALLRASLWSRFFDIQALLAETRFEALRPGAFQCRQLVSRSQPVTASRYQAACAGGRPIR